MSTLQPERLKCEFLEAPRGLAHRHPRFSWALHGGGQGCNQSAYEICVGTDFDDVRRGIGDMWQAGKTTSARQNLITYDGSELRSDMSLFWSVRVWDDKGSISSWAKPAHFFTGLMEQSDWDENWIARYFVLPSGREAPANNIYDNQWQARPADYLRRAFTLAARPVRATLYISALGVYQAFINGQRVGDDVLAPGWTDYHQRVLYQSFDVTELMADGANALGVILGEGWYSGRVGHNQRRAGNHYGGRPALNCQLRLHYADGSSKTISSNEFWKTQQGAICYSDLLIGEKYDARLALIDWHMPDFDDAAWQPVESFIPETGTPQITCEKSPPVREKLRLSANFIGRAQSGALLYDLGQNISGYVELKVSAQSGDRFVIRHGERLDDEGELYTENLRFAAATDEFISDCTPSSRFKPHFTFHGFQYVEVTVPDGFEPSQIELTGIAIWSDLEEVGQIKTGRAMLNQLQSNIVWSQRDNFISVPMDCPQRDERLGWSADAQVFWRTAGYNMDIAGFYAKWRDDIVDAQLPDGAFTDIAPSRPLNPYRQSAQPGAPGWGDAPIIMCWYQYLRYGDVEMLRETYPALKRWMSHIGDANPDFVRTEAVYNNYGDWLNAGPVSDRTMIANAYWAHIADLMAKIAKVLDCPQDREAYARLFDRLKHSFAQNFVAADGKITGDTQTGYLLALDFKLLGGAPKQAALARLLKLLDAADGHLQTGFLGVRHLCRVLADHDYADYAERLLLKETYPSWGFSIGHGATTIWERWDGWTPENGFQSPNMNSFNHYTFGSIGEWMFARLGGIDWSENDPGFRTVRMRPLFLRQVGEIDATYLAPTGTIKSVWKFDGESVTWDFTIPPNCRADIELPHPHDKIQLQGAEIETTRAESQVTHLTAPSGSFQIVVSL